MLVCDHIVVEMPRKKHSLISTVSNNKVGLLPIDEAKTSPTEIYEISPRASLGRNDKGKKELSSNQIKHHLAVAILAIIPKVASFSQKK